jgi:multiple sugar transport system substrate-binding protein
VFNKADPQEVLASWLFTQFLLTNDVQISYAETEGYVPVTSKAQSSEVYKTYLSNSGIDNDVHYDVKIEATKLLLENIENTFITAVFNGSANLRDAGGHLIEEVTKACRRKEVVDDAFMNTLKEKTVTLYHINPDQVREDLGPLPTAAKAFLAVLGAAWIGIAAYFASEFLKKRQCRK